MGNTTEKATEKETFPPVLISIVAVIGGVLALRVVYMPIRLLYFGVSPHLKAVATLIPFLQ